MSAATNAGSLRRQMLRQDVCYGAKMTRYYNPVADKKIAGAIGAQRCFYCACMLYQRASAGAMAYPDQIATSDHYIPYSVTAGLTEPLDGDKRVIACQRCNSLKGDKPADIYEYFVRQSDMKQPTALLRREFARFAYLLMAVGFQAAMADAYRAHPAIDTALTEEPAGS